MVVCEKGGLISQRFAPQVLCVNDNVGNNYGEKEY